MSQQYQKQKKKWFNQGKLQAHKEELEFLKNNYVCKHDEDCIKRIKQLQDEMKEVKEK